MPAFDPVRDAVLNSPITSSQPLPPTPASVYHRSEFPSNHHQNRRATDLSVLLNSEQPEPPISSPPPPSIRASTLSHILLHPDQVHTRTREPEFRQTPENTPASAFRLRAATEPSLPPSQASPHESRRRTSEPLSNSSTPLLNPALSSPDPRVLEPIPGPSTPRPSSSNSQLRLPTKKSPSMLPPPPPKPSTLPYNPSRITPPGLVMVPMSSDEMQRYKSFRGVGSQILSKRKRCRSSEPADDPEPEQSPAKKLEGDVEVVVGHCEPAES